MSEASKPYDVVFTKENDHAKFAVIAYEEYVILKELLSDEEKLADYLDDLHIQRVKRQTKQRFTLAEVKRELALDETKNEQ